VRDSSAGQVLLFELGHYGCTKTSFFVDPKNANLISDKSTYKIISENEKFKDLAFGPLYKVENSFTNNLL
jgi:hypothetical protein